jgi:uncharacterized SAM-binding protein YcdF (DUF218 family)
MFFVLSKILPSLAFPLPLCFLALLVILVFYHRLWARRALLAVVVCLYGLSIPYTANRFMHWLEVPRVAPTALRPPYDVVIVLTGMVDLAVSRRGRLEFTGGVDRILAGIDFVKQGIGKQLLLSGGSNKLFVQDTKEATLLQTFALQLGLTAEQVLVETASRNTYESAAYSATVLRMQRLQRALLITSAAHMRRSVAVFHKQGIFPDTYPVDFRASTEITPLSFLPSVKSLARTTDVIHELVGLIMYRLQGYL